MDSKSVCEILNHLLKEQPAFTGKICGLRLELTDDFADSNLPFVCSRKKDGKIQMGIIGIVNGLLDDGLIAASYDGENLVEFMVIE